VISCSYSVCWEGQARLSWIVVFCWQWHTRETAFKTYNLWTQNASIGEQGRLPNSTSLSRSSVSAHLRVHGGHPKRQGRNICAAALGIDNPNCKLVARPLLPCPWAGSANCKAEWVITPSKSRNMDLVWDIKSRLVMHMGRIRIWDWLCTQTGPANHSMRNKPHKSDAWPLSSDLKA